MLMTIGMKYHENKWKQRMPIRKYRLAYVELGQSAYAV